MHVWIIYIKVCTLYNVHNACNVYNVYVSVASFLFRGSAVVPLGNPLPETVFVEKLCFQGPRLPIGGIHFQKSVLLVAECH